MESNDWTEVSLPKFDDEDSLLDNRLWTLFPGAEGLELRSPMNFMNGIESSSNDHSWERQDWPNTAFQLSIPENGLEPSTANTLDLDNGGTFAEPTFDNLDFDHMLPNALNPESTALSQESIGSNDSGFGSSDPTVAGSQETPSVQQSCGHISRHTKPAKHATANQSNEQTSPLLLPDPVAQILAKSYLQSCGWEASKCTASLPHETARRLAEVLLQENGYRQVIPETAIKPFGRTDEQRDQHVGEPTPPASHPLPPVIVSSPQKLQTRIYCEGSTNGSVYDFDPADSPVEVNDSVGDVSEDSAPPLGTPALVNNIHVPDAFAIAPSTEPPCPLFTDDGDIVRRAKRRSSHSEEHRSTKRLKSSFRTASSQLGTPRSDSSTKSCMLCKMKHRSCQRDGAGPCKCCRHYYRCSEDSQSLVLAQSICQLPDDPALDVRASINDFFQLAIRDLVSFETTGLVTTIELAHPLQLVGNDVIHMDDAPKLTVDVEAGNTNGDIGCLPIDAFLCAHSHDFRRVLEYNNPALAKDALDNLKDLFRFQRQGFRIMTSKLPRIDALIEWAQYGIGLRAEICPRDLEFTLDDFLEAYVNKTTQLPLHDIAKDVFEISCLARLLDNRRPVLAIEGQQGLEMLTTYYDSPCLQGLDTPSTPPYMQMQEYTSLKNSSRVHEEIRNQLVFIAANAIEKREMRLMKRFDELSTQLSRRRGDIYILSACQERMRLFYRRNRNRYSNFFGAADRFRNNKTIADFMARRACFLGFMYTKGDPDRSPFSGYFKDQEREALDNDQDLIAKFERLKNAEHHFYEKSCDTPDDALYVQLQREKKDRRQKSTKTGRPGKGPEKRSPENHGIQSAPQVRSTQQARYRRWTLQSVIGPVPVSGVA